MLSASLRCKAPTASDSRLITHPVSPGDTRAFQTATMKRWAQVLANAWLTAPPHRQQHKTSLCCCLVCNERPLSRRILTCLKIPVDSIGTFHLKHSMVLLSGCATHRRGGQPPRIRLSFLHCAPRSLVQGCKPVWAISAVSLQSRPRAAPPAAATSSRASACASAGTRSTRSTAEKCSAMASDCD